MNKLLKEKEIFLTIMAAVLIFGAGFYYGQGKYPFDENNRGEGLEECQNTPKLPNGASRLVTKIIDGDTFLIEGGRSVRVLGIDADEREYPCYEEAKKRLEELVLNKKVRLEKGGTDKDQWCRYLRYVLLNGENIGLQLVKEGLAIARTSPDTTRYQKETTAAETHARENRVGCKWSAS